MLDESQSMQKQTQEDAFIQKVFFRMECMGTKIEDDNTIRIEAEADCYVFFLLVASFEDM